MSIMIDLPPPMADEAREYATLRGVTLEKMFFDYLKNELANQRKARATRLADFIGCIGGGRRTDDVVGELRGYGSEECADCLLTRDKGFYRDYFSELDVMAPQGAGT